MRISAHSWAKASLIPTRLRVLKPVVVRTFITSCSASLIPTRLRVLKRRGWSPSSKCGLSFTHTDPLEGTETRTQPSGAPNTAKASLIPTRLRVLKPCRSYGMRRGVYASLIPTRLRVLKQGQTPGGAVGQGRFTHTDPLEGTETGPSCCCLIRWFFASLIPTRLRVLKRISYEVWRHWLEASLIPTRLRVLKPKARGDVGDLSNKLHSYRPA